MLSRNLMSLSTIYIYRFTMCIWYICSLGSAKGNLNQTWWFENKLIFRPWNAFLRLKPNSGTFYCPAFEAWLLQPYPIIIPCKNAWLEDDSFNFLFQMVPFQVLMSCSCVGGYMEIRFTFSGQAKPATRSTAKKTVPCRSLSLESP